MNAGTLRERIVFEKKTLTLTAGQYITTWAPDAAFSTDGTLWAEAERLSEQNARFIIRYRAGIGPDTHRILFWNAIWTIIDAVPDRRHSMLTINSDFSALIEATSLTSTTREYVDGLPLVHPPK